MINKTFRFLLARAAQNRLAALACLMMSLLFSRQLTVRAGRDAEDRPSSRIIEGEYRRIRD